MTDLSYSPLVGSAQKDQEAQKLETAFTADVRGPRVVTLTPSPTVDRVYFVDSLQTGTVNRSSRCEAYFAGNGVNVARSLHSVGNNVSAVVALSSSDFELLCDLEGHQDFIKGVDVGHKVRNNTILVDRTGETTNINSRPEPISTQQWNRLCEAALQEVDRLDADWFVLGGSLPTNRDTGTTVSYDLLFHEMRARGISICLDGFVTGYGSSAAVASPPDLIKPNLSELRDISGMAIRTLGEAIDAANYVRALGIRTVVASLGADGILQVDQHGARWARGIQVDVLNTTGAGDAALAGYLSLRYPYSASEDVIIQSLARAVSWGALAVEQETTILPSESLSESRAVSVQLPDPDFTLSSR